MATILITRWNWFACILGDNGLPEAMDGVALDSTEENASLQPPVGTPASLTATGAIEPAEESGEEAAAITEGVLIWTHWNDSCSVQNIDWLTDWLRDRSDWLLERFNWNLTFRPVNFVAYEPEYDNEFPELKSAPIPEVVPNGSETSDAPSWRRKMAVRSTMVSLTHTYPSHIENTSVTNHHL